MKERATNEAIVKAIALIIIALVLLALAIFVPVSDAHAGSEPKVLRVNARVLRQDFANTSFTWTLC